MTTLWILLGLLQLISLLICIEIVKHGGVRGFPKISIKLALYDPWVGAFHDRAKQVWYVCPLPCVLLKFEQDPVLSFHRMIVHYSQFWLCRLHLPDGSIANGEASTRWGAIYESKKAARLMLEEIEASKGTGITIGARVK